MVGYGLVSFEKEHSYDVLKMDFISSPSGEYPTEGEKVQVRWRDKGTFEATLIATSEDEHQLIDEMEDIIARQNQMAMAASKKSKERVQQKRQGQQLLSTIEAQQTNLRKENTELKKEVAELRAELKNHRKLGAYLKTAEKLVRHLKCRNCGSKVPVLNEEKNPSGDEPLQASKAFREAPPILKKAPPVLKEDPPVLKEASLVAREAPPIFEEAPPVFEEAPPVFREAPPIFMEAPPIFMEAPPVFGEAPPVFRGARQPFETFREAPPVFCEAARFLEDPRETPPVYWDAPPAHREAPPAHREAPPAHREAPPAHREAPPVHREAPAVLREATQFLEAPREAQHLPREHLGAIGKLDGHTARPHILSGTPASQLLHSWNDAGVVELGPGSAIFIESSQLRSIETYSKTATATARGLLTAVFTQQALVICSVKGQRAKGSHRPSEQRPPLDVSAITAILSHTKAMCKSRGWDFNEKLILLSLGTKLSEMRSGVKQLV
ncbi:tropomyosin-1, isoforms 33/34-like [Ixodes scapularis]|uniref:tropomyosin-1, isoforms 33/34-like n=1 Tax=Ixodes scapularis TaxID=6945 RepID=UPI001AD6A258|nr:tropomyosin-1, isoforms 33/34-like [Ixodes scapularis]